ncbi:MAG: hypothetical protein CL677_05250 [Bdellovibrionaceae bacterium]|nr:hypothetical protein [Pseudobdellovibrionaceae bacterium]|tara:strand:+ start:571 stop:1176 length:606 start_codon:yes stop_codon:yes gene_type:complete
MKTFGLLIILICALAHADKRQATELKIWRFKRTLEVGPKAKAKDHFSLVRDRAITQFNCRSQNSTPVATLETKNGSFDISCTTDFPSGVFMPHYNNEKPTQVAIAQHSSDAGDEWSVQSLFYIDRGYLMWKRTTRYAAAEEGCNSSSENLKDCKITCSEVDKFYRWDSKNKRFMGVARVAKSPKSKIPSLGFYKKLCKKAL